MILTYAGYQAPCIWKNQSYVFQGNSSSTILFIFKICIVFFIFPLKCTVDVFVRERKGLFLYSVPQPESTSRTSTHYTHQSQASGGHKGLYSHNKILLQSWPAGDCPTGWF